MRTIIRLSLVPGATSNRLQLTHVKTILMFAFLLCGASYAANVPSSMKLPKSGTITLTSVAGDQGTRYDLSLQTTAGTEVRLKSYEIPRRTTLGVEWRALLSCDEDPDVIVVLMELNEVSLMLVQYEPKAKVYREDRVWAANLLQEKRAVGGSLKVIAPNRLILTARNHEPRSWSVVKGRLMAEDGTPFEGELIQVGTPASEPPAQTPQSGIVPDSPAIPKPSPTPQASGANPPPTGREPTSSALWVGVAVLIVAAMGLGWLFLRRRDH